MLNSYQASLPKLVVPSVADTMKRVGVFYYALNLKKLRGHIGLDLSVCPLCLANSPER